MILHRFTCLSILFFLCMPSNEPRHLENATPPLLPNSQLHVSSEPTADAPASKHPLLFCRQRLISADSIITFFSHPPFELNPRTRQLAADSDGCSERLGWTC